MRSSHFLSFFLIFLVITSSFLSIGSGSEEESVDTFNVHPEHRWLLYSGDDTDFEESISDGCWNVTDTGDSTSNSFIKVRGLQGSDDKINYKFKFDTNDSGTYDYLDLGIYYSGSSSLIARMRVNADGDDDYLDTTLNYYDGYTLQSKTLNGTEQCFDNKWYIFTITFDVMESVLRFKCEFENGTDIFNYDYYDIASTLPLLFTDIDLDVGIARGSKNNGCYTESLIDYIEAPFDPYWWIHTDDATAGTWITESPYFHNTEDDIDDMSKYDLVIPYFDSIQGKLRLDTSSIASWDAGDDAYGYVQLQAVNKTDGNLHHVFTIRIGLDDNAGVPREMVDVIENAGGYENIKTGTTAVSWIETTFAIWMSEDRSVVNWQMQWESSISAQSQIYQGAIYLSDVSGLVPSDEFIFRHQALHDYDDNSIEIEQSLTEFSVTRNDIFSDLIQTIVDPIARFFSDVITAIGLFLAWIFKGAIGVLEGIMNGIGVAIDALATDFWGTLEDFVSYVIKWFGDAITLFAATFIFGPWDALGLPNILAFFELGLGIINWGITNLILGIPAIMSYLHFLYNALWIGLFFYVVVLPLGLGTNIFEKLSLVIQSHFQNALFWFPDLIGFHFYLPVGIVVYGLMGIAMVWI